MAEYQRFGEYIEFKNYTQKKVADLLDVTPQYISAIVNGKDPMGLIFVRKVLEKFPDLNPDWFLTGRGEMLLKEEEHADKLDLILKEMQTMKTELNEVKKELAGYKKSPSKNDKANTK